MSEWMCVLCNILFTCNNLIMFSMFQRFISGKKEEYLGWTNVLNPSVAVAAALLQKTFPMPDSCDTSQKENFSFHINFPQKLSDFKIPFVKLNRTETLVEKFLSVTKHFASDFGEGKSFLLSFSLIFSRLGSSTHPWAPSCVKFNYSSPLYLWHVCERLQMRWVEKDITLMFA